MREKAFYRQLFKASLRIGDKVLCWKKMNWSSASSGQCMALISVATSAVLAVLKIAVGISAGSTSIVADGLESAGDVLASAFVFLGFAMAARPADDDHPYGHGRYETVTGLIIGLILWAFCYRSLKNVGAAHAPPAFYALVPLAISLVVKAVLSTAKSRVGRNIRSAAISADAWNDFVNIISAAAPMTAVGLTLYDPSRFLAADHYGGFAVGLVD
jgi:cation diffusion facilitator family transporter